jgi:hypothetical protein
MLNNKWIAIESRNAQLVFIEQFAKTKCGVTIDITVFVALFELTRSRVRAIGVKAQSQQRSPYRPLALSDEQEFELYQKIRDKAITGTYVRKRELINCIEANFRTNLTYG